MHDNISKQIEILVHNISMQILQIKYFSFRSWHHSLVNDFGGINVPFMYVCICTLCLKMMSSWLQYINVHMGTEDLYLN